MNGLWGRSSASDLLVGGHNVAVVSVRDVSKTYGHTSSEIRALSDINLDVEDGELVAVVGQSGSGKSTLMHILACLDRPTRGEYYLSGQRVDRLTADQLASVRCRKIGVVFQSFNLLPRMTAEANVALPLTYAGMGRRETRTRAERLLEMVGLRDRCQHLPGQLSGGEQQRVAIARALVTEPALLLADEPTGNLDSLTSDSILALLSKVHQAGMTVVIITHDQGVAARAGRVITIRDGQIVSDVRRRN